MGLVLVDSVELARVGRLGPGPGSGGVRGVLRRVSTPGLGVIRGDLDKRGRGPGHEGAVGGSPAHLVVGDPGGVAVEDRAPGLLAQPRHQPVRPHLARPVGEKAWVVAVTQLPQGDDDRGEAEDDVQEAHDNQHRVDEHGRLPGGRHQITDVLPVLVLLHSVGGAGVCRQPSGGEDDDDHRGHQRAETREQEADDIRSNGSGSNGISSKNPGYDDHHAPGYPRSLPGHPRILDDGGGSETHEYTAAHYLEG